MFVVDRIENEIAVIEWEKGMIQLPLTLLPEGIMEGDLLKIDIIIDKESTKGCRETVEEKANRLWE